MTQRILGPAGSPRRRRLLLFPALLTAIAALLFIGGAASAPTGSGVQNSGLFQLEGDTLPSTCASTFPGTTADSGDDWAGLYTDRFLASTTHNPPCHSDAFAFVADGTGAGTPPDHSFWSQGGSKDAYDPALGPWLWKPTDVSPDKNDLVDAFAAMYHTGSTPTDLKRFIYFGSDRFDVSGDAQQGFQFLQNATCLAGTVGGIAPNSDAACPAGTPSTPNTTCTPAFTGSNAGYFVDPSTGCPVHHKNGDLLVLVNFNNGGVLGLAGVYEWWGANGAGAGCYGTPQTAGSAGICDQPVLTGSGANCATITSNADFCSTANTGALASEPVWSYTRKGGGSSYQASAFIEGGLNLARIPGAGACFPTFVAETRSSGGPSSGLSLQAQLKDLAMGRFQLCGAAISISPNGVNGVGSNHTFTVTVSKTVAGTLSPVAGVNPTVTLKRADNTTLTPSANTCTTTGTDANGQCTVTFTSTTADVVTGHASANVVIDGTTFPVQTDGTAPNSGDAVKRFVDANVSITPNGVNAVGSTHTFNVSTTGIPSGTTASLTSITPSVDTGSIIAATNTCADSTKWGGSGTTRTCSFQVTSSTAAVIVASAQVVWHFVDNDAGASPSSVNVTRSTDSTHGSSGSVTKRFVDANVSITPNGVNEVGTAHTFTVSTTGVPSGTNATLLSITPSVVDASNNAKALVNNNCANSANWGGSGTTRTCTFQINSTSAGVFTANATVVWRFADPDANANPASVDVTRSTDSTHGSSGPVVKRYVDANVSITPNGVNEVNHAHMFNVSTTGIPSGTSASLQSITPSVSPSTTLLNNTCANSADWGGSGTTRTCHFEINSSTPGVFTANATVVWRFTDGDTNASPASVDVTRTTDSTHGSTGPATKRFVDAYITIGPPTATNNVGQPHTFVVNVFQNDGLPAGAPGGDASNTFGPAPDGTSVTVTLTNSNGANWQYVAPGNTCSFIAGTPPSGGLINGQCGVTFSSATAGTVTGHASVTFSVGGVSLTRQTDGNAPNSGDAVKNFVAGSLIWHKVDNGNRPQGGATFDLCQTHTYNLTTNQMDLLPNPPGPICQSVVDKTPTNAAGYTGLDEDGTAGNFKVSGLQLGRYTVHETVAPPGFEPDTSTKTADLVPGAKDGEITTAFVNRRPVLKIAGFGYTNSAVDAASQPDGIFKGSTTYTVTLHNYGTAAATLSNSSLVVSGNATCTGGNTLSLSGSVAVGADSSPFTLTCTYDHPDPAKITADLTVKYTTNGLERTASGSPAEIFFTVNPN